MLMFQNGFPLSQFMSVLTLPLPLGPGFHFPGG